MRVIAGTARGKNLQALPGEDITRPTINRVKEAMFSSVQFLVPGARVLDLFAGSGQLGIEALSRGAKSCLFVDRSTEALAVVKANCKTAGVDRQSDIRQGEAESFLANIRGPFDLALLDPPFHHDTWLPCCRCWPLRWPPAGSCSARPSARPTCPSRRAL